MEDSEKQEVKTKKDLFRERMSGKYPDLNLDDEESFYGRVNDDYDEYDGKLEETRKNEESLSGLFASDPRSASFLMGWKNGENPVVQMIRMYGDDFKAALEDPEMQEQFAEASSQYLSRITKDKELQEQASANLTETLANLDAAVQEGGYSEEQADDAYLKLLEILENGIVNKVSKETWLFIFKAINHDTNVETAAQEAEVRGRNTKIDAEKKKKTTPDGLPPMVGGQGGAPKKETKKSMGALDRYEQEDDIFNRGGIRRGK